MHTKLTLRLEKSVIDQIKIYALKHHLTLSGLTEKFYKTVLTGENPVSGEDASPLAKKYRGIIKGTGNNYETIKYNYLKDKHLK